MPGVVHDPSRRYSKELRKAVAHVAFDSYYFDEQLLRADDVFLASYPRSGNHFLRFFIASAQWVRRTGTLPSDYSVMLCIPDLHNTDLRTVPARERVIKTHFPFDPRYQKIIHLIRDPRDVLASYYHYTRKVPHLLYDRHDHALDLPGFSRILLRGGVWPGSLMFHTDSFSRHKDDTCYLLVRYEDLLQSPEREFRRVLHFLKIDLEPETIGQLISHVSFDNMSRLYSPVSAAAGRLASDRELMLRRGQPGGYREEFDAQGLEWIARQLNGYLVRYGYDTDHGPK